MNTEYSIESINMDCNVDDNTVLTPKVYELKIDIDTCNNTDNLLPSTKEYISTPPFPSLGGTPNSFNKFTFIPFTPIESTNKSISNNTNNDNQS
mmetsp:Transcript_78492/g.96041  ORF Transcript_78492/g.96041 Transcript_78492/m.96041 type:complete len:94 (-) Transcript_78492:173-454(-)